MTNEITTVDLSNKRTFLPSELYLPEWARETEFFRNICILINYVEDSLKDFSNAKYAEVAQAYKDLVFLYRDMTQLSEEAIRMLLRENGFSAILDVLDIEFEKLQMLAIYLPLFKALKGTDTGFRLLLKVISHDFEIINWLEDSKNLDEYTYNVTFITFINAGFAASIASNFAKFSRSYVYPVLKNLVIKVIYRSQQPFVHGRPIIQKDIKVKCLQDVFASLTINAIPEDAKVTLTCEGYRQEGSTITVPCNSIINWSIDKEGYVSKSGTIEAKKTQTLTIELTKIVTLEIQPTPENASVSLLCGDYKQIDNKISVPSGSTVYYSVEETHYSTNSGSYKVTEDTILPIKLVPNNYTLTIVPIPSDATVTLTAKDYTQIGNSITVPYGTSVDYEVSASGYITSTYSAMVLDNAEYIVELEPVTD